MNIPYVTWTWVAKCSQHEDGRFLQVFSIFKGFGQYIHFPNHARLT